MKIHTALSGMAALCLSVILTSCFLTPQNKYADIPVMDGTLHITTEGETLGAIARTYDVSVPLIRRVNNVTEIGTLPKNTRLFIPGAEAPKVVAVSQDTESVSVQKPEGLFHPVDKGETLSHIAEAYDITMAELQQVNNLYDPNELKAGDKLWIPRAKEVQDIKIPTVTIAVAKPIPTPKPEEQVKIEVKPTPEPTQAPKKEAVQEVEQEFPRAIKKIEDLKFQWPIKDNFTIVKEFDESKLDMGLVLGAKPGTPVHSIADGVVEYVGTETNDQSGLGDEYGNYVIVYHGNINDKRLRSLYFHNQEVIVKKDQEVKRGEQIAIAGNTGNTDSKEGAQLQLQLRDAITVYDPMDYLPALQ